MDVDLSSADFFETKYRQSADPWNFAVSPYEQGRYGATLAALAHRRYRRAFEPGCSVGVLTEQLAGLCDAVEAIDFAPSAVETARRRCAALPHVHIACADLGARLPLVGFDLVVLSEIGYYFEPETWRELSAAVVGSLPVGATLLAVHWLGHSDDHRMSGDAVHEMLLAQNGLRLEQAERHLGFRLERWSRV